MGQRNRRQFSGVEKVEILKRHFIAGERVSDICEELKRKRLILGVLSPSRKI